MSYKNRFSNTRYCGLSYGKSKTERMYNNRDALSRRKIAVIDWGR
jgi:hypothetical protein